MRRPWIALALLVAGCAGAGIETAALDPPLQTGSVAPSTEAADTAHGDLRKVQHKAVEEARRPLRAFLSDQSADCSSPKLQEAARRVSDTATAFITAMRPDYAATLEAGAAVLDVANVAMKRGCTRHAKALYEFVLRNFAGLGYAELREQATGGLKDLRAKS